MSDQLLRLGLAAAIAPVWILVLLALIAQRVPRTWPERRRVPLRRAAAGALLFACWLHFLALGIALAVAFR